ncbi:hypothetical protein VN97_g8331, partial [Penicillium thymicola]
LFRSPGSPLSACRFSRLDPNIYPIITYTIRFIVLRICVRNRGRKGERASSTPLTTYVEVICEARRPVRYDSGKLKWSPRRLVRCVVAT